MTAVVGGGRKGRGGRQSNRFYVLVLVGAGVLWGAGAGVGGRWGVMGCWWW